MSFGLTVLITKGDLAVFEFEDAVVAEGDSEDIGGKISEGSLAAADGLTANDPILLPGQRRDLAIERCFLEGVAELGTEDIGQGLNGDQELGVFGWKPLLAIHGEAASGHQIVDVGMVAEIAGPSL